MVLNLQLVTMESVTSLRLIFPGYCTFKRYPCNIHEFQWVNSILILLLFLFSLLIISMRRDPLIIFTVFWKCFLFFYLERATSYPYIRLQKTVQTLSLLISFLLFVIVCYREKPNVARKEAGSYFSTVRICLLNRTFPLDFILEIFFFSLPDASCINRGRTPKQELGTGVWCLIHRPSDRHIFCSSYKQYHHPVRTIGAILHHLNLPIPFSQNIEQKRFTLSLGQTYKAKV